MERAGGPPSCKPRAGRAGYGQTTRQPRRGCPHFNGRQDSPSGAESVDTASPGGRRGVTKGRASGPAIRCGLFLFLL